MHVNLYGDLVGGRDGSTMWVWPADAPHPILLPDVPSRDEQITAAQSTLLFGGPLFVENSATILAPVARYRPAPDVPGGYLESSAFVEWVGYGNAWAPSARTPDQIQHLSALRLPWVLPEVNVTTEDRGWEQDRAVTQLILDTDLRVWLLYRLASGVWLLHPRDDRWRGYTFPRGTVPYVYQMPDGRMAVALSSADESANRVTRTVYDHPMHDPSQWVDLQTFAAPAPEPPMRRVATVGRPPAALTLLTPEAAQDTAGADAYAAITAAEATLLTGVVYTNDPQLTITVRDTGQEIPIPLPTAPGHGALQLRMAVCGGTTVAVCKGWGFPNPTPNRLLVASVSGVAKDFGPLYGDQACFVTPTTRDGKDVALVTAVINAAGDYQQWYLDPGTLEPLGDQPGPMPGLPTSQGMLNVEPDGTILWTDPNRTRAVLGVNLTLWMQDGDYVIGQATPLPGQPTFPDCILVADLATGDLYLADGISPPSPPQMAIDPATGLPCAAISLQGPGQVLISPFLSWTRFTPPTAPTEPTTPTTPTTPPTTPTTPEVPTMPVPTPADLHAFDFDTVQSVPDGGDPRDLPRRNRLIVEYERANFHITIDGRDQWPIYPFESTTTDGNMWFGRYLGNREWLFGPTDWFRGRQDDKGVKFSEMTELFPAGERHRWGNLVGWVPQEGEIIAVMMSTPRRGGGGRNPYGTYNARTNVVFLKLSAAGGGRGDVVWVEATAIEPGPVDPGTPNPPTPQPGQPTNAEIRDLIHNSHVQTVEALARVAEWMAHIDDRLKNLPAGDGLSDADRQQLTDVKITVAALNEKLERGMITDPIRLPYLGTIPPISVGLKPRK